MNTYVCAMCKQEFPFVDEEEWSDEEAIKELSNNFPGSTKEDSDVVCDNCYKEIMR